MKAISTSLGHYNSDFTKEIYVKSKMKVVNLASMMQPFVDEVIPESKNAHSLDMPDVTGDYDI